MKILIVHSSGPLSGTTVEFNDARHINFGRKTDNDVVFAAPEHHTVSGFHAQIQLNGPDLVLHDLGSTHGTFLNDRLVTRANLSDGDNIRLCPDGPQFTVRFMAPVPAVIPSPDRQSRVYGQRTVGILIQRALEAAGLNRSKGTSKPTAYFEAMLEDRLQINSRRHRIAFSLLAVILVLILVIGAIIFIRHRNVTINQTTQLVTETAAGGSVARANRNNLFVIAGMPRGEGGAASGVVGFCTAFAVSPNLLATNAHCILRASKDYSAIEVRMNGAEARSFGIVRMVYHPGYLDSALSPDVGLIQINAMLPDYARLADAVELQQVAPGVPVFLYGFPGRLNNLAQPEATFVRGEIGRLTTFSHSVGAFEENTLLQHSAFVAQGTSGSPMFNAAGRVIGINAGGYSESGQALPGYNFGMRIDLLDPLIRSITSR